MENILYVLKLEGEKYYVGKTSDVKRRFEQHVRGTGAEWTKLHKPVKLLETKKITSEHDENNVTKDLMKKYGMENVRGGAYASAVITEEQEQALRHEIRSNTDTCYKCGKAGHFARYCKRTSSFKGICECGREFLVFEDFMSHQKMCIPRRSISPSDVVCYRCDRPGHYANNCYAYTTEDGEYLGKPKRDYRRDWSDDDSE